MFYSSAAISTPSVYFGAPSRSRSRSLSPVSKFITTNTQKLKALGTTKAHVRTDVRQSLRTAGDVGNIPGYDRTFSTFDPKFERAWGDRTALSPTRNTFASSSQAQIGSDRMISSTASEIERGRTLNQNIHSGNPSPGHLAGPSDGNRSGSPSSVEIGPRYGDPAPFLELLKSFISRGKKLRFPADEKGFTVLADAASKNHADIVRTLLEKTDIDPNTVDRPMEYTPVMWPQPKQPHQTQKQGVDSYLATSNAFLPYAGRVAYIQRDKNGHTVADHTEGYLKQIKKWNITSKIKEGVEALLEKQRAQQRGAEEEQLIQNQLMTG